MNETTRVFAPGCALMLYKPHLVEAIDAVLSQSLGETGRLDSCCRNMPELAPGTEVIDVCPGCDKRYRQNYPQAATTSLWEILARSDSFAFPDYRGQVMAILDACPTRDQPRIHDAVRRLLERMNISIVEPKHTRNRAICCGDSAFGEIGLDPLKQMMRRRAAQMPADDVVVYCVSCAKSMIVGGRRPHYLIDLLFGEETVPGVCDPEAWHQQLEQFIQAH
jgi:Fe-S oxidoreductase